MLFSTSKGLDSDPERQLAVLLDSAPEVSVARWMKPAENQFQIEYEDGQAFIIQISWLRPTVKS